MKKKLAMIPLAFTLGLIFFALKSLCEGLAANIRRRRGAESGRRGNLLGGYILRPARNDGGAETVAPRAVRSRGGSRTLLPSGGIQSREA